MFCAYTRPRYRVSVYRTIGPLVQHYESFFLFFADVIVLFVSSAFLTLYRLILKMFGTEVRKLGLQLALLKKILHNAKVGHVNLPC